MTDQMSIEHLKTIESVDLVTAFTHNDLNDLCDATDSAIKDGGGFGWVNIPSREILERFWQGVVTMPQRLLFVGRLDGVICATAQIVLPASNNEAQKHAVKLTMNFTVPWARGQGISGKLFEKVETTVREKGYKIINLGVRDTQEAAIRFYERHGFTLVGKHPFYAEINGEQIAGRHYYKLL